MKDPTTLKVILRLMDSGIGAENGITVREVREDPGVELDSMNQAVAETPVLSADGPMDNPEATVYLDRHAVLAAVLAYASDQ